MKSTIPTPSLTNPELGLWQYFPIQSNWQMFLVSLATLLTYYHTLDVPFYLDDFSSIQENPVISQWSGSFYELWQYAKTRIIGYWTFALNFQVHQFEVAGYHAVNMLIHVLSGIAVLFLLKGMVRTPVLADSLPPFAKLYLPPLVALLFVLHPLQISAVTYIVQRLASLGALFYLLALACYVQMRLTSPPLQRMYWGLGTVLCALLAFGTKQHTLTLPVAMLLVEWVCFVPNWRRLLILVVGLIMVVIGLGVSWAWFLDFNPFSLTALESLTRETVEISRLSYFATQMQVLWTYLTLFVFPSSAHIDYAYPIVEDFLHPNMNYPLIARLLQSASIWALLGHVSLFAFALYLRRRCPWLSFAILFYYLAHSIESSLIPIRDVIFLHRTYLPNFALCLALGGFLTILLPRYLPKPSYLSPLSYFSPANSLALLTLALLITLGTATWQRNELWRDPIALWQHNVILSPEKQRGWIILGKHLIQADRPQEGIEALERSFTETLQTDGSYAVTLTPETALNLVVAYKKLKQYSQALDWVNRAFEFPSLQPMDRAKFLINQGNIFFELKSYSQAISSYRTALQLNPYSLNARINLASVLGVTGQIAEAKQLYQEVLKLDPNNLYVQGNLQRLQALSPR